MAKRPVGLSILLILAVGAFGLWATGSGGRDLELASLYLASVGISLGVAVAAVVAVAAERRDERQP